MKRVIHHLIIPAILPAVFAIIASVPLEVFGCRNRGLMAAAIALSGALAALGTTIMGARCRWRADPMSGWWLASTLILLTPAVALIILA